MSKRGAARIEGLTAIIEDVARKYGWAKGEAPQRTSWDDELSRELRRKALMAHQIAERRKREEEE